MRTFWLEYSTFISLTSADQLTSYNYSYEYDPAGNRTKVSDSRPDENYIIYNDTGFDPANRTNSIQRKFDGKTYRTEYGYDKAGLLTSILYPEAQNQLVYQYDSLNRLQTVVGFTKPQGITYNLDGNVNQIAYENGVNTVFSYDINRRLQDLNTAFGATNILKYHYGYDSAGNITAITNGVLNKTSAFTYYDNNWLKSAVTPMSPLLEKQTTPGVAGYLAGDYLSKGTLDFAMDQKAIVSLDTNAASIGMDFGKVAPALKKIQLIPGAAYLNHRSLNQALDLYISSDNNTYQIIPRGQWEYQEANGIVTLTFKQTQSARYLKIHFKFDERDPEYTPLNQAEFLSELGQTLRVYQEAASRTEEYNYDPNGNRNQLKVILVQTVFYDSTQITYYEKSDRLKTDGQFAYVYDKAGNLIKKGNTFTVNGETVTFTTQGPGVEYWRYIYDLMNHLVEVRKNGVTVVNYGYDPDGLRVWKKAHGETTHYIFEGTEPIYEKKFDQNDQILGVHSYIYALGNHLARVDGVIGAPAAKVYYYHLDHTGSVKSVTDQQGLPVYDAEYSVFGIPLDQSGSLDEDLGFTGKEFDKDTGLYYFNARWYDSETGRFISEDPLGQGPNFYSYCGNNPLTFLDPTGLWYYMLNEETGNWYAVAEEDDTLWDLSNNAYGTGDYAEQLQTDNGIKDPTAIQPGDSILMGDYNDIGRGLHGDLLKVGYLSGGVSYDTIKAQGFNPWSLLSEKEQMFMAKQYRMVNELYNAGSISEEQYNKEMFRMETQDGKAVKGRLHEMAYGSCSAGYDELWALGGFTVYKLVKIFGPAILSSPIVQQLLQKTNDKAPEWANNFRFGQYTARVLEADEILVRYFGGKAHFSGRYLTSPSGITGVEFFDRMSSAIRTGWNTMEGMAWFRIPAGTLIYEGQAATKFPWIGGGYQVFINLSRTEIAKWIIGIE